MTHFDQLVNQWLLEMGESPKLSGRQDLNLRPIAPKAIDIGSIAFSLFTNLLESIGKIPLVGYAGTYFS